MAGFPLKSRWQVATEQGELKKKTTTTKYPNMSCHNSGVGKPFDWQGHNALQQSSRGTRPGADGCSVLGATSKEEKYISWDL